MCRYRDKHTENTHIYHIISNVHYYSADLNKFKFINKHIYCLKYKYMYIYKLYMYFRTYLAGLNRYLKKK